MKKVSVIITCYNHEDYLDEAINSIRGQIEQPDEIILVHDGCTKQCKAYGNVTTVFSAKNQGVCKARDIGFKISTGSHIIFYDADDVMPPNYIKEMVAVDADVVYPNCVVWSHWGESTYANGWHEAPEKVKMEKMLQRNEILMTSMFKREWYDKVGGFDETLPLFEDYSFWLKCLSLGAVFKKSRAFLMYRQREKSRNHQSDEIKVKTYRKIVEPYLNARSCGKNGKVVKGQEYHC